MAGLFDRLDQEWASIAERRQTARALEAWGARDRVLAGFADGHELVGAIRAGGAGGNDLLAALAAHAPTDELAARVILQALVPGLVKLAGSLWWWGDVDEVEAEVVAKAWHRARTYPLARRPLHIAANLLLDTRKAVTRARVAPLTFAGSAVPDCASTRQVSAGEELLEFVIDGLVARDITVGDAGVVISLRLGTASAASIAEQSGCTPQGVRQRRRRAEMRMTAAAVRREELFS